MKNKKMIVQLSEGLGNQLFMYAHGYALSKNSGFKMIIDNVTGYERKKNLLRKHQKYMLDYFKLDTPLVKKDFLINSKYFFFLKKIIQLYDKISKKKTFYIEDRSIVNNKKIVNKLTRISPINLSNKFYVIGNYENPEYFNKYQNDIIKKFQIKEKFLNLHNPIINDLLNSNSVSIHLRRDKFSDQQGVSSQFLSQKSENYTNVSVAYTNKAITYFINNIKKPKFFIWSNNFDQIEKFTSQLKISDFVLVNNNDVINDFYLFNFSKHFIVSPSTFHWWGAWLNQNKKKICVRPSDINPSNNLNFWPKEWIKI